MQKNPVDSGEFESETTYVSEAIGTQPSRVNNRNIEFESFVAMA
jgi:hypothetical protein